MISPDASTSVSECQCLPGYTPSNSGGCTPCPAGQFKVGVNSDTCSQCRANSQSVQGSAGCLSIPGFTIRNLVRFTRLVLKTIAEFDEAAQLQYRHDIAAEAFVSVEQVSIVSITEVTIGRRLLSTAVNVETEISASVSETGNVTATFENDNMSVTEVSASCPEDTYKADTSNADCVPCPANSHSNASSTECTCDAGFYGIFTNCQSCAVDNYCEGDGLMVACPGNSTAPIGSEKEDDCTCVGGFQKLIVG
tara:strand:- start:7093 stop:7845 length:753 start_codon:yes stop_codon:yes gene_type:complete